MYAVDRRRSRADPATPSVRVVDQPAPRQFVEEIRHRVQRLDGGPLRRPNRFTISVDGNQPPQRCCKALRRHRCRRADRRRGAYGYLYERHALELTRADVPVSGLPPALAGLRIGLMTDIHRSRWVSARGCHARGGHADGGAPDLIVLGGDYVTWGDRLRRPGRRGADARCRRRTACSRILGNHDDDHDMPAALTRRGIEVLRDARTSLTISDEALELAGIRFWTRRLSDIAAVVRGATGTVILLAHDPRRLTEAAALEHPAGAVRPHARRAGRAAGRRRRRGAESFRSSPASARQGEHDDVRQPRDRNGLRAGSDQLPAGSRAADAGAGTPRRRRPNAA